MTPHKASKSIVSFHLSLTVPSVREAREMSSSLCTNEGTSRTPPTTIQSTRLPDLLVHVKTLISWQENEGSLEIREYHNVAGVRTRSSSRSRLPGEGKDDLEMRIEEQEASSAKFSRFCGMELLLLIYFVFASFSIDCDPLIFLSFEERPLVCSTFLPPVLRLISIEVLISLHTSINFDCWKKGLYESDSFLHEDSNCLKFDCL